MAEGEGRIIEVKIEDQMKTAYIDYSMSVIVARALPDARDGFKPVHRRILYGMYKMGVTSNKPTKKSAAIVGEVLGKYHPHGDSSVYGALVHMAQPWALRYPLVYGQGNFGSAEGDGPAAMRYTEARMEKIAEDMMIDIDKETVDMVKNYDESIDEPTVLPTRIPSLLVNGSSGIAVGMATMMAPHNLRDAIDACVAYVDNKDIDIEDLIKVIKAPDFPTGTIIMGMSGVRDAYMTGRGRIILRSRCEVENIHGKDCIVIKELPYMVQLPDLLDKIKELIKAGKIDGISDYRNESKTDTRVVLELRKDAIPNVVLNHLYKNTPLQSSFGVNNIALVGGRPKLMNLKDIIKCFVDHRHDVVVRRAIYDKRKAEERAHILEGRIIACDNIDEVVHIIRSAEDTDDAKAKLRNRFALSEVQANDIVEMRLRQLTKLSVDDLKAEYAKVKELIDYLTRFLADESMQLEKIKEELIEIRDKYGDDRRTSIDMTGDENFRPEDFYDDDDVVVSVSHMGYIKRTMLSEFKTQNRGGMGSKGSATRDQDFIEHIYYARMHDTMMFFTQKGRCFWYKVFDIPEGNKQSKGRAVQNLLNIEGDDKIKAFITVRGLEDKEFTNSHYIIMATKSGIVKRTSLDEYSRPRQNGIIAITVREDDELLKAVLTDGKQHLMLATSDGRAVRFPEETVRCVGRTSMGVKGIDVGEGNTVVGFIAVEQDSQSDVFVLSEKGFGKRSKLEEYSVTSRGCKGVRTLKITDKTGMLVAIDTMTDEDDLMIINKSGITIRIKATDIKTTGRATQGLCLINLSKKKEQIASGAVVPHMDEEEEAEGSETPAETEDGSGSQDADDNIETNGEGEDQQE